MKWLAHMRWTDNLRYLCLSCLFCCSLFYHSGHPLQANPLYEDSTQELLDEALLLYHNSRGDAWIKATDPYERFDVFFSTHILERFIKLGDHDLLFAAADEAFEFETDRLGGAGAPPLPPKGLPPSPRPIHIGERGGLDGASCRACHFSGGPDGAGSGSQLALFRGDGERLSSSTPRNPPALMGVGYIALAAQEMSQEFQKQRAQLAVLAKRTQTPQRGKLIAKGIHFGWLTVLPNGEIDPKEIEGVSADLIIRPFGWKGRHHDLVALADEALQLHHGLQSDLRAERYADQAEKYIGLGPAWNPDQDEVEQEIRGGHVGALAAYMSLLSIPSYRPPNGLSQSLAWASGRRIFEEIGCAQCHQPSLMIKDLKTSLSYKGKRPYTFSLDLGKAGQEPRPRRLDYSSDATNHIFPGTPIFLFSDLKRHRMGSQLAEPHPETLPDGVDEIDGDLWLTRPLWGLADSAPYLHDGRAQTVEEAILAHGGEGEKSRTLYQKMTEEERGHVRLFLMSLSRSGTLLVE